MKAVLLRQLNESRTYDNELYMHQVFLTALENTPLLIVDPHLLKISTIPPTPFIMGVLFIRKHQSLPRTPLAINFGLLFFVAGKGINAKFDSTRAAYQEFFTDFKRRPTKSPRTTSLYVFCHNRLTYETQVQKKVQELDLKRVYEPNCI